MEGFAGLAGKMTLAPEGRHVYSKPTAPTNQSPSGATWDARIGNCLRMPRGGEEAGGGGEGYDGVFSNASSLPRSCWISVWRA